MFTVLARNSKSQLSTGPMANCLPSRTPKLHLSKEEDRANGWQGLLQQRQVRTWRGQPGTVVGSTALPQGQSLLFSEPGFLHCKSRVTRGPILWNCCGIQSKVHSECLIRGIIFSSWKLTR